MSPYPQPTPPQQWRVVIGLTTSLVPRTCEEWEGRGWTVHTILAPRHDNVAIVFTRERAR